VLAAISDARLAIGLVVGIIIAALAYRESERFRTNYGVTPWGVPSALWAGIGLLSLIVVAIVLAIARGSTRVDVLMARAQAPGVQPGAIRRRWGRRISGIVSLLLAAGAAAWAGLTKSVPARVGLADAIVVLLLIGIVALIGATYRLPATATPVQPGQPALRPPGAPRVAPGPTHAGVAPDARQLVGPTSVPDAPAPDRTIYCSWCGQPRAANQLAIHHCGSKDRPVAHCSRCGTPVAGHAFCHRCGTPSSVTSR